MERDDSKMPAFIMLIPRNRWEKRERIPSIIKTRIFRPFLNDSSRIYPLKKGVDSSSV